MKKTVIDAHDRLTKLETSHHIQFREVFYRLKRVEAFLIAGLGAVITMLVTVLLKMG